MKIAVVGATGLVGQKMLKVLAEHNFPVTTLIPVASERSAGKNILFGGKEYPVCCLQEGLAMQPHIALFSAGKDVSLEWAPRFVEKGCTVIDNSSAWRMHDDIRLVVPEVNATLLDKKPQIIANPNCSTIQLVAVLYPLHKLYGLKRVIVSTYQSVSGSGYKGVKQLLGERAGSTLHDAYPHQIDLNCIPHGGNFLANSYTDEEMKLVNESRKILSLPQLALTGTVVRVPVIGGHSESVNIEFQEKPDINQIRRTLSETQGIVVKDIPTANIYPMPIWAEDRDEVFVGRIRKDESHEYAINLWIVADNLRKGAATNAVQIAEYLIK
ncbi:MAG: aspartate-semialdehyde dehydrogenase [Bacteroidales bacterium]|nr:aspartate-semialdehyde dehydrogenase [Bacteroidales bacterium]HOY37806.1 aspartate-semialdehyde dehydrogenase [Bacteroidales bacterium]